MKRPIAAAGLLVMIATLATGCRPSASATATARAENDADLAGTRRNEALATARVWSPPALPISRADLRANPAGAPFSPEDEVTCRFTRRTVGGTTPKFYCELPAGEVVKVKYGASPELQAEVAASRLLTALGFGADQMYVVGRVRCAGCPAFPFQSLRCFDRVGLEFPCFPGGSDPGSMVDFGIAVLERRLAGRVVEAADDQGWAWFELDRIDPARGGSSRAEVDALRLMAVFLAHWDNKAPNQRLLCLPGSDGSDGACARSLAIMQDLGATFGPTKIDLHNWRRGRIWKDGAPCTVSMEHLPWGGGTFPERQISEPGRRLLLSLLEQLSEQQIQDLFEGSRVTSHDQFSAEARRAVAWSRVFTDKIQQIRDAGPCPS